MAACRGQDAAGEEEGLALQFATPIDHARRVLDDVLDDGSLAEPQLGVVGGDVDPDDADAQDVMLCINTGKFRTDSNRMKMDGHQYYLRRPEEMYEKFCGLEDAVARSQEIARV